MARRAPVLAAAALLLATCRPPDQPPSFANGTIAFPPQSSGAPASPSVLPLPGTAVQGAPEPAAGAPALPAEAAILRRLTGVPSQPAYTPQPLPAPLPPAGPVTNYGTGGMQAPPGAPPNPPYPPQGLMH